MGEKLDIKKIIIFDLVNPLNHQHFLYRYETKNMRNSNKKTLKQITLINYLN